MTLLTCVAVRRRLPAFYDRELPIPGSDCHRIAHLGLPALCRRARGPARELGDVLRCAAAPGPADDWTGLQSGVISRMRAEAHEAWTARTGRMFDDMHLVWIGFAAAVATMVCGMLALGAVHFASPERDDSLAAMIRVISAPSGSDLNPVKNEQFLQVPTVPERGAIEFVLAQPVTREELVLALNAVVMQDGRVSGLSVLGTEPHPREFSPMLRALSNARFEPGRLGTSPVAVNLVWLLAHTTVKAKAPRDHLAAENRSEVKGEGRRFCLLALSLPLGNRRRDVVHGVHRADDDAAAGLALLQHHLELFPPRVRDAVLRIDRPPPAGVERILHAQHRRALVADDEADRAGVGARRRLQLDARRRVVDLEAGALELSRQGSFG